jgi:hypothetical protein
MGLFDLIDFMAEKAYDKYKDSKMESAMDSLLEAVDTCSVNLEILPYDMGDNPHILKGKVYRFGKDQVDSSAASYFLVTNSWLKKAGVNIDDEKIYQAAFNEKGGLCNFGSCGQASSDYKKLC